MTLENIVTGTIRFVIIDENVTVMKSVASYPLGKFNRTLDSGFLFCAVRGGNLELINSTQPWLVLIVQTEVKERFFVDSGLGDCN